MQLFFKKTCLVCTERQSQWCCNSRNMMYSWVHHFLKVWAEAFNFLNFSWTFWSKINKYPEFSMGTFFRKWAEKLRFRTVHVNVPPHPDEPFWFPWTKWCISTEYGWTKIRSLAKNIFETLTCCKVTPTYVYISNCVGFRSSEYLHSLKTCYDSDCWHFEKLICSSWQNFFFEFFWKR